MFLNTPLFAATAVLTFLVARLLGLVVPSGLYFTFESFLFDHSFATRYYALALKLVAPVLAGFVAWLLVTRPVAMRRWPLRRRALFASASLFAGGVLAAFVSAWPFILYWDVLAVEAVRDRQAVFMVSYVLYFASFGYFALLGGQLAQGLVPAALPASARLAAAENVTRFDKWRVATLGSVTSLAATGLADLLGHAR